MPSHLKVLAKSPQKVECTITRIEKVRHVKVEPFFKAMNTEYEKETEKSKDRLTNHLFEEFIRIVPYFISQ